MTIEEYHLTVLNKLLARTDTMEGLVQAITDYPEDTKKEGSVRSALLKMVASFRSLDDLQKATQDKREQHYRESFARQMDFDEFLYGWDE